MLITAGGGVGWGPGFGRGRYKVCLVGMFVPRFEPISDG